MNECKKISVIVPVYNVEQYLNRCIDSILGQTYSNLEVILVDDGSTDGSGRICDNYVNIDKRVKAFHKINGGLSSARNYGLKRAGGEFVAYVDSDDYIEKDSYRMLLKGFTNESVDFVAGDFFEHDDNDIRIRKRSCLTNGISYLPKKFIIESIRKNEWYAPVWCNLYRKNFLVDNNLLFKEGFIFEDTEIQPRLCLSANRIGYVNYPFYHYIHRKDSIMTADDISKKRFFAIKILTEWFDYYDNIDDAELQRYLYGILVRYYLTMCRNYKIEGWQIKGINFKFAMKYALNIREKAKVLYFNIAPRKYITA